MPLPRAADECQMVALLSGGDSQNEPVIVTKSAFVVKRERPEIFARRLLESQHIGYTWVVTPNSMRLQPIAFAPG